VTRPVFSWRIESDGALRIYDYKQATFVLLQILRVRGTRYIVDQNGKVCEFRRKKWPEYYGWHPDRNESKEPNQAPEPTPTAVTPPAGQEARQP
jgi:hypothetical protein